MSQLIIECRGHSDIGEHRDWLIKQLKENGKQISIASPYVTDTSILQGTTGDCVRILTTFSDMDIAMGATSLDAISELIRRGVQCRYFPMPPRLHAKVYIFSGESAMVTSANLTMKAMKSNIEVGLLADREDSRRLLEWFEFLWADAVPIDSAHIRSLQRARKRTNIRADLTNKTGPLNKVIGELFQPLPASFVDETRLRMLLQNAKNAFVCNTNRRDKRITSSGKFLCEELMRNSNFAAAWPTTKKYRSMQKVSPGDVVLMYAKKMGFPKSGIIGIGEATGTFQRLQPSDGGRILTSGRGADLEEWRVPVRWAAWKENDRLTSNYYTLSFHPFQGAFDRTRRDTIQAYFLDKNNGTPMSLDN